MRQLSLLVTTALVLVVKSKNTLDPKGPPCPDGDGLYAVGCSNKYLQCVNNVEYEQSCPPGLFFDRLMSRCERRSNNHLCNNKNRKTLNVRQKSIAINCVGRLSGDYPLDKNVCSENFYTCSNGVSYMRVCPHNQKYNPIIKGCDYADSCKEDGVKNHAAAALYSPTYDSDNFVVTTKEFENGHKGIDCVTLGDSYINQENECSPYFWQCANGKLFRKTCPAGLIYVFAQNLCDYPQGVRGCPEYDGSETVYQPASLPPQNPTTTASYNPPAAPTVPYHQPRYEAPVDPVPPPTAPVYTPPKTTRAPYTTTAAAPTAPAYIPPQSPTLPPYTPTEAPSLPVYSQPISYQPAIHGDCKNREDGFFETKPCHSEFLACSNKDGRVVSCAADLVFDARISACDYVMNCNGPRIQEYVPNLYNHGPNKPPATVKVDFNCTQKANGKYFKEACTKNFFVCHEGRAFSQSCPGDLVYNKANSNCDFAENCESNYMEPSQMYPEQDRPTTTVSYQPSHVYTTQPPRTVTYTQPPRDTPSTIYYPTTTVGYQEPSTTTVAYTTPAPSTYRPISVDDFSCARLSDGDHASGLCQNVYFTCSNHQVTARRCPADLVFNPYLGMCDYQQSLRDCEGYQPVETTTAMYSNPESTTREYSPARTTTKRHVPVYTEAPTTTPSYVPTTTTSYVPTTQAPTTEAYTRVTLNYGAYCELLADGNYGFPCFPYFLKCDRRKTIRQDCPAGLYYDTKKDRCDYKFKIEECPEYHTTPSTTPAAEQPETTKYGYKADKYPNIDYTTTTPGPVDTTPIAEAFSCYGRPDGIYALPYCSKDYVQCIHGRSLIASCASGLFYSEMSGLCDYKSNVAVCKIRHGSDTIDNNACLGKADGYYSAGCSSYYFSCVDEKIRKTSCPNKLKFSEKKGICTYATDASECFISAKPERTPPAVPSDFCTIRSTGLHAFEPCSPHYIVCDNSRAIAGACAAPLVYNAHNQLCDYKSNNRDCGSDYIPTTTQSPSYTTKAQDQPSTTTTKPYQPQTAPTGRPVYTAQTTTTTQKPYEHPTTTTTAKPYETTTPSRDIDVPTTTTGYQPPVTTTTAQSTY